MEIKQNENNNDKTLKDLKEIKKPEYDENGNLIQESTEKQDKIEYFTE